MKTAATATHLIEARSRKIVVNESQGGQWVPVATIRPDETERLGRYGFNVNSPAVQQVIAEAQS